MNHKAILDDIQAHSDYAAIVVPNIQAFGGTSPAKVSNGVVAEFARTRGFLLERSGGLLLEIAEAREEGPEALRATATECRQVASTMALDAGELAERIEKRLHRGSAQVARRQGRTSGFEKAKRWLEAGGAQPQVVAKALLTQKDRELLRAFAEKAANSSLLDAVAGQLTKVAKRREEHAANLKAALERISRVAKALDVKRPEALRHRLPTDLSLDDERTARRILGRSTTRGLTAWLEDGGYLDAPELLGSDPAVRAVIEEFVAERLATMLPRDDVFEVLRSAHGSERADGALAQAVTEMQVFYPFQTAPSELLQGADLANIEVAEGHAEVAERLRSALIGRGIAPKRVVVVEGAPLGDAAVVLVRARACQSHANAHDHLVDVWMHAAAFDAFYPSGEETLRFDVSEHLVEVLPPAQRQLEFRRYLNLGYSIDEVVKLFDPRGDRGVRAEVLLAAGVLDLHFDEDEDEDEEEDEDVRDEPTEAVAK
ncbi:MAG TPA: hypothetical protein QGF58_27735 [Myxococcota bacterium]|nr:hypothetical protein [Myxococcota bacterium]